MQVKMHALCVVLNQFLLLSDVYFVEIANKVLSECVTRREVNSREFKMVYEVDYSFLEEYNFHYEEDDDISQYHDEEDPEQDVDNERQST